jgi:hypothetical protein
MVRNVPKTAAAIDGDRFPLFLATTEWISPRLILDFLVSYGAKNGYCFWTGVAQLAWHSVAGFSVS